MIYARKIIDRTNFFNLVEHLLMQINLKPGSILNYLVGNYLI